MFPTLKKLYQPAKKWDSGFYPRDLQPTPGGQHRIGSVRGSDLIVYEQAQYKNVAQIHRPHRLMKVDI